MCIRDRDRLIQCGFPSQFISWIHDYLSDRYQYVRIGNTVSSKVAVTSGVPQGSILGPYLFALTTGTFLHDDTKCHMVKYADDTTLCFPIYKPPSTNQHISQQHNKLIDWSVQMDLKINNKKCQSLIIRKTVHCDSIALPGVTLVDSLKVLGVFFNSRATWSLHFDNIVKLASRRFYALRLLRPCLSKKDMITVYNAILPSILEYCAPLFLGLTAADSNRLEKLQKRFHRMLYGDLCRSSCLTPLSDRRFTLAYRWLSLGKFGWIATTFCTRNCQPSHQLEDSSCLLATLQDAHTLSFLWLVKSGTQHLNDRLYYTYFRIEHNYYLWNASACM